MAYLTKMPGANTTAQWFADDYPGIIMPITDVLVLHTTEGGGWPSYMGGKQAPTMTILPDTANKRLLIRQHFPLNMSARALRNEAGGVTTNTAGVIQIELVGTCEKGSGRGMYWPDAPEWALDGLAQVIATLNRVRGIPLIAAPVWRQYPSSYGNTASRFTDAEWLAFKGICGHQHVPENSHGDPGNLPVAEVVARAKKLLAPPVPKNEDGEMLSAEALDQLDKLLDAHAAFMIKNRDATIGRSLAAVQTNVLAVAQNLNETEAKVEALHAEVKRLNELVAKLQPTQPSN